MKASGTGKIRIGAAKDGGYVLLDDFAGTQSCLSLGVGRDVSFDLDLANRGIQIFQFDHTIEGPPVTHPNFTFHRERVAAVEGEAEGGVTIPSILVNSRIEDSGLLMKMDIEGGEWPVFAELPADILQRFSQITCELHGFAHVHRDIWFERARLALSRLTEHFAVVHVHANNHGPMVVAGQTAFPNLLEVTFASRARYTFEENTEEFPTVLDAPNARANKDYSLGRFQY
jgi:hypothetical protein